jgi:ankyrin repeat protein
VRIRASVAIAALGVWVSSGICADIDFVRDVKPLLQKRCWGCHGPDQQMGSFRLDQKERALISGRGVPAIVPGASYQSLMYRRISSDELGPQMPLTGPLGAREIETIKRWIDAGAPWPDEDRPAPKWKVEARLGPLFEGIRRGDFQAVRAAVKSAPDLAKARNSEGSTLLAQTALYGGVEDVRWLLAHGSDSNVADEAGVTPLICALDDAGKVEALLAGGADAKARTGDGQTAMLIALEEAVSADVVKLLLEHGASADPDVGTDPLVLAGRNSDPVTMQLLAAKRGGAYPAGALTGAASMDCMECVQLILKHGGASKTTISNALYVAATTGRVALLETLLKAGADANVKDSSDITALMRAAYSDYAEVDRVRLLLEHGAQINARDTHGSTALSLARSKGRTAVVDWLVKSGAKE